MISNQVSLTNLMLNIAPGTDTGITLNKGELLSGIVQEVKDEGLLALLIKGKLVEAISEVAFAKGQQVFLSVDDIQEGRIFLKLMTPEGVARLQEASLSQNLKSMGIKQSEQVMVLAKKLLQYNLPVTQDNMNASSRAVRMLGGFTPQNVELAVLTRAGGLPINEPAMNAVVQFLSGKNDVAQIVNELTQAVNQPIEEAAPAAISPGSSASGTDPAVKQQTTALSTPVPHEAGNPWQGAAQAEETGSSAPIVNPRMNGLESNDLPEKTAKAASTGKMASGPAEASAAEAKVPAPGGNEYILKQTQGIVGSLLRDFAIHQNDGSGEAMNKMQERPQTIREFVNNLVLLQDVLQESEHKSSHPMKQIVSRLEALEKEIGGQQIVNNLGIGSADKQSGIYYYSFPVQTGDEYRQVQLRVQNDSSGAGLDKAKSLSLVVALDTGKMGKVLFHVDWSRDGYLGIRGVVEASQIGEYLESQLEYLLKALTDLGYRVENRGFTVSENIKQESELKPVVIETRSDIRILGIDIRV